MRIQVVFNNTPVLVPCGDGKLTVAELIQKAIVRFKKVVNKHPDDVIEVRSIQLAESGSFVDQDDEVLDVLEDKEAVVLDFQYVPRYARDTVAGTNRFEETLPASPAAIVEGEGHPAPFGTSPLVDHHTSERYATGESNLNDTQDASQEDEGELSHHNSREEGLHLANLEASQDPELVLNPTWPSASSQEHSPHLSRNTQRWNSTSSGRDILTDPDSGYAPTKSQESYGHSQSKSQEAYTPVSGELSSPDFTPGCSSQISLMTKRPNPRKEEEQKVSNGPKPHEQFLHSHESRNPRGGREPHENFPLTPTKSREPFGIAPYGSYPFSRGEFRSLPPPHAGGLDNSFERRHLHQDRRSLDYYPDPYMSRYHGEHSDMFHGMRPGAGWWRDRMMREESRMQHARSHEQMDLYAPGRLPYRLGGEDEIPDPVDNRLSQPDFGYWGFERPPGYGHAPYHPMMGYDPRLGMGGPSFGVSLSQPVHMMSHMRPMHGEFERGGRQGKMLHGERRFRPKSEIFDRQTDRPYFNEEFDRLDEEEEMDDRLKVGARGSFTRGGPFQRDFRKSMFHDGRLYAQWMERCEEFGIDESEANNGIPEFEGDTSQSQRSRTPSPLPEGKEKDREKGGRDNGEDDSDDEEDYGNILIVELHKGEDPLGIHLTHYTSPEGHDLGVYIGAMDMNGFAAKSGKLQVLDRVLACNGVDFTKERNTRVEELFLQMAQEPLLRMAISRGPQVNVSELQEEVGRGAEGQGDHAPQENQSEPSPPKIAPSSVQPPSNTLTNTRQIGVKHTIELQKGTKGFGFGLSSRDVSTDEQSQPIYVKSILTGGPAFVDGRLKIGDRILEVDGVSVTGMSQPQVVQLLRRALGTVTLLVSRQETIDAQEEEEFPSSAEPSLPTTVDKTVMTYEIPLYNSGPAGLGVTVYGRTSLNTTKKQGDMGIYIKSIVPGGAAALDGRLCRNDQLLCINGKSLLGRSNQEALDTLRKALASATGKDARVQLVVARRRGGSSKTSMQFGTPMGTLGEEPEEEEREMKSSSDQNDETHEVGIDVPAELHQSFSQPTSHPFSTHSITTSTSLSVMPSTSQATPWSNTYPRPAKMNSPKVRHRTMSPESPLTRRHSGSTNATSPSTKRRTLGQGSPNSLRRFTASPDSPTMRRHVGSSTSLSVSSRSRTNSVDSLGAHHKNTKYPSPQAQRKSLPRSEGLLGSGEYYDRLSPALDQLADQYSSSYSDHHTGYERNRDYSSLDRKGMIRSMNQSSEAAPSLTSSVIPSLTHNHPPSTTTRVISPSDIDVRVSESYSDMQLHDSSLRGHREFSPFDPRYPSYSSPYSSDSASIVSYPGPAMSQLPTRGSGRRDRNIPERGSGRYHAPSSVSPVVSSPYSDIMSEGYSTLPRSASYSSGRDIAVHSTTPTNPETSSLEHLRLSDSEPPTFRRDAVGRISITKKTKKNPRQDLAHLQLANTEPLVEGEVPLIRTGSDPCLNETSSAQAHLLVGMELGPSLGMVKSSSLESLHNVMHHTIKREALVEDGSDLLNRRTRNSFRRAVDRSYDEVQQRGVDVPFGMEGSATVPAVISFTKSPLGKKQPRKKGFFKRVFKKRKSVNKEGRSQVAPSTKSVSVDSALDEGSDTPRSDTPPDGVHTYTITPLSLDEGEGEMSPDDRAVFVQRHSVPVDDYDSMDEDRILATMARV